MAKRLFQLFVRQHQNDAFTVSALHLPSYAAYAETYDEALEELSRVLAGELALGVIKAETVVHREGLERKAVHVTVRAVQHGHLIEVPLRVTALYAKRDSGMIDVTLPRLGSEFSLRHEKAIEPWTQEVVRAKFHLADVERLREYEYDRGERVDEVEITYRKIDGKRLESARGPQTELAPMTEPDDEDVPDDTVLGGIGSDLVITAKLGELGRCYERADVLAQLERVLGTRQSVLLVGPSGSGKTAVMHELAHRIHDGVSPVKAPTWHITAGRIMARTPFLGMWQKKALDVLQQARLAGAVLYLGDLLELAQATRGTESTGMSLPRLIEPFVAQRDVIVIAEATPDALSTAESIDPGLPSRMRHLVMPPLDATAGFRVLETLAGSLGARHGVRFTEPALQRALDLVARFGDVDGLPGSGLTLVERMARGEHSGPIGPAAATAAFAAQTGYPKDLVDPDKRLDMSEVHGFLEERVHGQPRATHALSNVVAVLKAGLDDPGKPVASFLFMGPTGVGKTESALSLAEFLFGDRERVVRLDMSEYADAWGAVRLVDGRRGEGELTRPLREQPFSVVLLDEIEKAAPEVFDVLLQVLGEGRLTDATGRTASFRHAIVIMTSNLGAAAKPPLGVRSSDERDAPDYLGAARRFFRPEMLNRIDHIVPFDALAPATLLTIARRLLDAALRREGLSRRGLEVRYDDALLEHLAAVGFDPALGARPMKRAIDASVLVPLAQRIARGEAEGARVVQLELVDGVVEPRIS